MQGGYKAAAMSGVKTAAPPAAANGSSTNANGVKKNNAKKKPATNDKGNGKATASEPADASTAAPRAPPPGFSKAAPVPNAWATPLSVVTTPAGFSDSQQRLLRHRALFVFRFLVGKAVDVTLVDASRYVGILDCIDPDDFSIVLKNTQRKDGGDFDSGSTVIFKRRQLAHMAAEGVVNYDADGAVGLARVVSGGAPGFRTDTEITNRSHEHLYGRELESAASWLDPQLDTGDLEDPNRRKSGWNQFEVNEKLFGVVSTYDENLYTTKLDKTKISNEKSREAERLAREIERETTGNFHLQEERGQAVHGDGDLDEEARYSSVDRKAPTQSSPVARNPNAYVPPALRNASRPTSAGQAKPKPISPNTPVATKPATAAPASVVVASQTPPAKAAHPTAVVPTAAPAPTSATLAPAPLVPVSTAAGPTPLSAPDAASQPRKPISFSEAVTGRPTARPSPTLAPTSTPALSDAATATKAVAKQERKASSSPKKQPSPKSEKPANPPPGTKVQKATPAKGQADKKPTSTSSEKKPADTKESDDAKAEKKAKSTNAEATPKATPAAAPAEAATSSEPAATTTATSPALAKKTTLNPKAKEFKLSASAATFTPKFATPPAPAPVTSPYRQPSGGHYGHMHPPPPHPMGYVPGPEEWMYDGMMLDEGEYAAAAHAYMGYGVPMMPNPAMMQQPMYAPMMPPQQNVRMGRGGGGGYGYNQPGMYNPRGYYGHGAAPGAIPAYHSVPGAIPGIPQPPLPPTPADGAAPVTTPASPSLSASSVPPCDPSSHRQTESDKNTDAPPKK